MKYTIQKGVDYPFSERARQNLRYIVPLLVILAGILTFALYHHVPSKARSPLALGIYSIKSHDSTNSAQPNNSGGSGSGSNAGNTTAPTTLSPLSTGSTSGDSGATAINTSTTTPPASGGGLGGGGSVTNTVTCDDNTVAGAVSTVTCTDTACTPNIVIPAGQKVLVNLDGTCAVIDP